MINLLPYDKKADLHASRNNSAMMKCLLTLCSAAAFLACACMVTIFFLNNSKEVSDTISKNTESNAETTSINKQVQKARADLSTANQILSQQISYSKLLDLMASAIPSGVILDNLDVDNNTIDNQITVSMHANTTDKINQIAKNFQSSPAFSSYDFVSAKQDSANPTYSTAIVVKVKVNKSNIHDN